MGRGPLGNAKGREGCGRDPQTARQLRRLPTLVMHLEGDLDLHRFLGLGGPRAGFSAIRATGWVRSPNATKEQLEELCQYVQDTSPVRDILANAVPVSTDLVVLQPGH